MMVHPQLIESFCASTVWEIVSGAQGWERSVAKGCGSLYDDGGTSCHLVRFTWTTAQDLTMTRWVEGSGPGVKIPTTIENALRHPGVRAMVHGHRPVIRLSDVVHLPRFRETALYATVHAHPEGTRFANAAVLELTPGRFTLLGSHRSRGDFTADDMVALEQVQVTLSAALALRRALDTLKPSAARPVAVTPALGDYWPTPREQQVLALVAQGCSNQQIARRLGITERTVRKHLDGVYTKADVHGRASAVAWWLRQQTT